ncbi:molybdenum cofactor biosynthesis protein A [Vibrio ruber DSM 16370]|uniref:Molybdenum cofactor biosynthesis protein A n=1 Tax=Vibrio ruber (strain DSM 16370 / JCM 11486 / BCRC 17186 / CECT 7878 / LMG 23124 / VR1) TaxID=1123498 RepID=A0A1R4LR93_VIBR1|nr:radical SAM protein [Vibrio ruber]SJN59096.1 molybdenum cofactor biosynthesis protein A [Vibrio ruber DSM 16370]
MSDINQLTILTTNRCTASCEHCLMNSSRQRREKLSLATICDTVDQLLSASRDFGQVIFAGGEPTLLRSELLDAIAYCHVKGLKTRIVTNASWASSRQTAEQMIESLREAGLAEINYSVDDYHLPFVPFERVANAWRASKNKGFESVVIANCYGPRSTITHEYICAQLGEDIATFWDDNGMPASLTNPAPDGTRYLLSNAHLQRLGRGADIPDTQVVFPKHQASLNIACPWAVRSAALSAQGHLVACCGTEAHGHEFLDFGAVNDTNVAELLERGDRQLVVRALRKFGPYFLMQFVREFSDETLFHPKTRYSSVCEICENVLKNPQARHIIHTHLDQLFPLFE